MRFSKGRIIVAAVLLTSLLAAAGPADADGHLEVVAEGLDNPRGLDVEGHHIYVAEAGRGGDELVDIPLGGGPGPVCVGRTGAVSRVFKGRVKTVKKLPSVTAAVDGKCEGPGFGIGATGPHGVDVEGHRIHYTVGLGGTPVSREALAAAVPRARNLGTAAVKRGRRTTKSDLAGFEDANDPNGDGSDSNPYGVMHGRRSTIAVDAGGNSLLRLKSQSTEVLATFAPNCVPFLLGPNPVPPDSNPCGDPDLFPAQAVPTAVAVAHDGDYLVTTLLGFPFTPGHSVVWKIDHHFDGTASCSTFPPVPSAGCEVFADGLTALVGIAVARNGTVYVVQLADGGVLGLESGAPGADAGSVKVLDGETGAVIGSIDGLNAPGGIDIHRRHAYITNFSVSPGGGQIVRTPLR